MNKAGKFMIAVFTVLAVIISTGLIYMFVVGHEAEGDGEESASAEESAESFDLEEAAENAEDGEVIWSAELDDLQLSDFSIDENGAGITVSLSDSSSENVDELNQALADLPIAFETEDK